MRTLYFFTASFPFGSGEQFIETEINYTAAKFSRIEIVPLYVNDTSFIARIVPNNVVVHTPILSPNNVRRILGGIAGNGPWRFAFDEWKHLRPHGVTQVKAYINWVLITRTLIANSKIKAILQRASEDDVLYFYWGAGACFLLPFAKDRRAASVVRFHNWDLYEKTTGGCLPFRHSLLRNADYIVPISDHGAEYLRTRYPSVQLEPEVFRLGTEDFGLSMPSNDNVFRVCSCSSITSVKRVELIARVLASVNADIEWTHIGDGPLRSKLEDTLTATGGSLTVRFCGRVPNEAVKLFYRNNPVDLFINLSSHEGVPVSIMEALSAGIPVVATDCGGVSELVDTAVGALVPVDFDVGALTTEIERLAKTRDLQMRDEARKRWRSMCDASTRYKQFASFLSEVKPRAQPS